jgi:hypothetical protein
MRWLALLVMLTIPAVASEISDNYRITFTKGCTLFFWSGYISPGNLAVTDINNGAVLFSLAPGQVVATDVCLNPNGSQDLRWAIH